MAERLHLTLNADSVAEQCARLLEGSRQPGHALAALTALQSCVAAHTASGDHAGPAYRAVQDVIGQYAEEARQRVLAEQAAVLQQAILDRDCAALARAHGALSRNGFWQVAGRTAEQLGPERLAAALDWLRTWNRDARARALAASPYPDALDFRAAAVDPLQYAAMEEALRALDAPASTSSS